MTDELVQGLKAVVGQLRVNELRAQPADAVIYSAWRAEVEKAADCIEALTRERAAVMGMLRDSLSYVDEGWLKERIRKALEGK